MAAAGIGDRVEGFHAVAAALEARRVRTLVVESGRLRREEYRLLVERAEASGARVRQTDDVRDEAVTEAPQGVFADCEPISSPSLDDVIRLADPPALVVLDHLEDPRNLGAIARSAHAASVPALVVPERRSAPLGATAFKVAAGALEWVAVARVGSIPDAMARLRQRDVWLVGLDGTAERSLFGHELLGEPVALVLGGEGRGLSRLVGQRVDTTARIPMAGGVESLNVAVAGALAVFELARVRGWIS